MGLTSRIRRKNEKQNPASRNERCFLYGGSKLRFCAVVQAFLPSNWLWGTTQVVENTSDKVLDRSIIVRFDANVNPALDWKFLPTQRSLELSLGENALAFYRAENTGSTPVVGTATFNVTPDKAVYTLIK